ncbi:MAG TPA: hypothetical protein VLX31_05200 [Streptosporangiaceae bacterium]|nr:hypothetical protein [Streptosporangiaceae bacterium]
MYRRLPLLLTVSGLLLYGSLFGSTAATAATTGHVPNARHHYCVARAPAAAKTPAASRPAATCYATFPASIRAATRGLVRLSASTTPRSVTPGQINADAAAASGASPDTTYVISIDYQNVNFGGSTLTWTQSSKCGTFSASSMPSGWNDAISSVSASSGCATTLFWNIDFGSPTYPIAKNGSKASLGSFNDETSSQTWCTAEPCGS